MLPNQIFNLGLNAGEIAVYAYLMRCEDRKTYQCHPSFHTIGGAVGLSKATVQKHVRSLEEKQLITTQPTTVNRKSDGRKRNGSLLYTIQNIAIAEEHFFNEQMKELARQRAIADTQRAIEEFDRKHKKAVNQ